MEVGRQKLLNFYIGNNWEEKLMSYIQIGSSKILLSLLKRGTLEFKKCYKITANLVQNGKCDLLADSHSILNRWKNRSCQLLNVHGFKYIKQTEIHTAEILLPKPSAVQVEMTNEKLKVINYHTWLSQVAIENVQRYTILLILYGSFLIV